MDLTKWKVLAFVFSFTAFWRSFRHRCTLGLATRLHSWTGELLTTGCSIIYIDLHRYFQVQVIVRSTGCCDPYCCVVLADFKTSLWLGWRWPPCLLNLASLDLIERGTIVRLIPRTDNLTPLQLGWTGRGVHPTALRCQATGVTAAPQWFLRLR